MIAYVIYSKSEDAYWDNEVGWLDEVDLERADTMIFSENDTKVLNLPVIKVDDISWEVYSYNNEE